MAVLDPATNDSTPLDAFRQDRVYLGADHRRNERRTWIVMAICVVSLALQLGGGLIFRSLALVASGLHMAAHVAALLTAAAAYGYARRYAGDPRFVFGTGKLGYLAGFANGVVLITSAVFIGAESFKRLAAPEAVNYEPAIPLAVASLVLTLVCAALLRPASKDKAAEGDLNLAAAHMHLSADALVSILAIAGLSAGKLLGWAYADSLAGLVGAVLVAHFAIRLLRRAGSALLDMNPDPQLAAEIRHRLQGEGESVIDLHLWRLGPGHNALVAVVAADAPKMAEIYRARLAGIAGLSHVTVEVRGPGEATCDHGHRHS